MKINIDSFSKDYVVSASKYITYFNEGNKAYEADAKKLTKLNNMMRKDKDFAKKVIDNLISSDNVGAVAFISIMCLELNYRVEEAINKLNVIKEDKANGPFGVFVNMHLTKYNKNKM